jgi:hypothetical protein
MKYTFTMHFIFGTEMDQFVELVQTDAIYKTKVNIIERKYIQASENLSQATAYSGYVTMEMENMTWLYNIGQSMGMRQTTPF